MKSLGYLSPTSYHCFMANCWIQSDDHSLKWLILKRYLLRRSKNWKKIIVRERVKLCR